ncbi:uncharacterized protein LOC116207909 isoform X3 [Punica granatum]|uniref:Uncharacterized protein LOC116207909 isoform X3 n=1 Tax=Punica granatum TaxID=22663 RepID=A0A6P8DUJ5_PUNGR|nr:uncharacterized protein LOC116207909 isoform X3 [Punica granatum]
MYLRASVSDVLRRRIRFPPGTATGTITATATATSSSVTAAASTNLAPLPPPLPPNVRNSCSGRGFTWRKSSGDVSLWFMLYAQAVAAMLLGTCSDPVFAEGNSVESSSLTDPEDAEVAGLRRVDDDAVISNEHTMKWRIFTDNGRDSFQKAELYRVMKAFDKAEPLQLEAINILEDSFGPEDIRVGVAFHNLGQLYLVQRKLEDACSCYQRALKIKGRVLGHSHPDYADTMYHLGKVLHLQGKEKESEALIVDSIRILEEGGHGQSNLYMRRLRHLAQLYLKSSRPVDAENVQRKILHALELVKGWDSLDTVMAAEGLALTLQSAGKLREAHELLERCLDARKKLLPEYHIQTGANMLHLARVAMLYSNQLRSRSASDATIQLEKAKDFLENCIRISQQVLIKLMKQKTLFRKEDSAESRRNARIAMIILMQALDALGLLEINRMELQDSRDSSGAAGAENALLRCIDAYKEFERESSISDSVEVRTEYLKCLKHLLSLLTDGAQGRRHSRKVTVKELKDEINHVESEVSASRGHGKKA